MPPVNHVAISAGVIAVSVAVAAAIAVYESPELRRMADDLRRRIAIALHSLGDNIQPDDHREPRFNRPEDAEGFMQSRSEAGVDADEETKRRQREELMYWNSLHLQNQEKQNERTDEGSSFQRNSIYSSTTFDSFLRRDADKDTYVLNTGADTHPKDQGLVRRRGAPDGVRGLNVSLFNANPFSDEHGIENDDESDGQTSGIEPSQDEVMSDIYNATEPSSPVQVSPAQAFIAPDASADHNLAAILFDAAAHLERRLQSESSHPLSRDATPAGPDQNKDAFASIQAWAQTSQAAGLGFYSPLPVSPSAPVSEPELVSEGAMTPTDSMSLISAAERSAGDAVSVKSEAVGSQVSYDVVSEDGDGIATPVSWSEVGSVVSENDAGPVHA